jgi:hypothetical protein
MIRSRTWSYSSEFMSKIPLGLRRSTSSRPTAPASGIQALMFCTPKKIWVTRPPGSRVAPMTAPKMFPTPPTTVTVTKLIEVSRSKLPEVTVGLRNA